MHRRKWGGNRLSQQDTWGTQSLSCCSAKSLHNCGQMMLWQGDQIMVNPKHWFIWQGQGGLLLLTVICFCDGYATQYEMRGHHEELQGSLLWPTGDTAIYFLLTSHDKTPVYTFGYILFIATICFSKYLSTSIINVCILHHSVKFLYYKSWCW